jgi:hypothetical protein
MNNRIAIALVISISLHAAAVAVSFVMPNAPTKASIKNISSPTLAITIENTALPLPDAMSPLLGNGADAIAKLDGATAQTKLDEKPSEDSIEKSILQSAIGDASSSKTKALESSAAGANGKYSGLKSVLISAIQFDPDFYPPKGGKLKVRIDIDESGIPTAVTRISHSPKSLNVDYFLDSILEARFIPAQKDGALVSNTIVVEINLMLEDNVLAQHFIKN